jgi:Anti-sigma factor NepR
MHIGVVNAARAAMDDELSGVETRNRAIVDRLHFDMTEKPPSSKSEPRASASASARLEPAKNNNPAFDTWLEKKLHNMFDAVASEPLPPDLVKLLEKLDQKTGAGDESKK